MPLSANVLAAKAAEILSQELKPIRYQLLANRCIGELRHECHERERLDIQEQLALWARHRKEGLVYLRHRQIGDLHHIGLAPWFDPDPFPLLPGFQSELQLAGEADIVDLTAEAWSGAWYELEQRTPYMQNKYGKDADKLAVDRLLAMTAEEAAKEACRRLWPRHYYAAENHGNYRMPCDHDFRLLCSRRKGKRAFLNVDVCTPNKNTDRWGPVRPGLKNGTDAHLCVRVMRENGNTGRPVAVQFHGFLSGSQFSEGTHSEAVLLPMWRFQLFINCEQEDVPADLETLRAIVNARHAVMA